MEPRGRVAQSWNICGCHGRAPSPKSSRPSCDLAPRVQVFPATRGGREQKNGSASAPGKGRVKSSIYTTPSPLQKDLYKIRFGVVAGERHPPQYFGPGLSACAPEEIRTALYRAPPCGPCVGSVGVRAFSFSRLPQSLGV